MEEPFDPYLHWLAIRDPKRPPNHYRMLGIDLFESDLEVIQNAADRQMTHVRGFQGGKHSADSQRILNELATAKICLLKAEKKAAYDTVLRTEVRPTLWVTSPPPVIRGRDFSTPPPSIELSLTAPIRPPVVAGSYSAAEDVLLPSKPLSTTRLPDRQAGKIADIDDANSISGESPPPRKTPTFLRVAIFLCMLAAVIVVLVGLLALVLNSNRKAEEPPAPQSVRTNDNRSHFAK
jgi:hypothetical protein